MQLLHGDCLELMQTIPDKSIDLVLCDLPYGTTACKWDVVIPFEPLWAQYKRLIKYNGAIVLFSGQPFTSALVMSNPDMFKYEWIWEKDRRSGYLNAKSKPLKIHENILVFHQYPPTYNPQMWQDKPMNTVYRGGQDLNGVYGKKKPVLNKDVNSTVRYPIDIIKFNTVNGQSKNKTTHGTQKPVPLMVYLIKTYTNEGETVLDNCMGSGTTGVACVQTGRDFIGIEKDDKYFQIAKDRIESEARQIRLC